MIDTILSKRDDFLYNEINEDFLDLRNINHLQDLVLFKAK